MKIELKKFGTILTSRQLGKEAFAAFQPILNTLKTNEKITIDFEGVTTFSPSWGDEFLTPLMEKYASRITLHHTQNPSVRITLELLKSIHGKKFGIVEKN